MCHAVHAYLGQLTMLYCVMGHIRLVTVKVCIDTVGEIVYGEIVYVSLVVPRCIAHAKLMDVQADKSRVKDYINRLDNFDGPAVGEIAVGYEMFEEAFEIYKKFGLKSQAIKVLLDHQNDLDRAFEYAGKVGPQITCCLLVNSDYLDAMLAPKDRHGNACKQINSTYGRRSVCALLNTYIASGTQAWQTQSAFY